MTRIALAALACARLGLGEGREQAGGRLLIDGEKAVVMSRCQAVHADADTAHIATVLIMEVWACESGVRMA